MERQEFLNLIDLYLDREPDLCEEVLNVVSKKLKDFRTYSLSQSTVLADQAINMLASAVDFNKLSFPIEFLIDTVIHECRGKEKTSLSNATRELVRLYAKAILEKSNLPSYMEFVKNTRGAHAEEVMKWVLETYKPENTGA